MVVVSWSVRMILTIEWWGACRGHRIFKTTVVAVLDVDNRLLLGQEGVELLVFPPDQWEEFAPLKRKERTSARTNAELWPTKCALCRMIVTTIASNFSSNYSRFIKRLFPAWRYCGFMSLTSRAGWVFRTWTEIQKLNPFILSRAA